MDESGKIGEETYGRYLKDLLSGNHAGCASVVEQSVKSKTPVRRIYADLFQRSLYEVGELWEFNKISVAVEHVATAVTEGIMNRLYSEIISPKRAGKKAVVASVENELHQVGAKMVADMFEMGGWDAYYLGANTPTYELVRFVHETGPDVIGLSLSVFFHMEYLENMITTLGKEFETIEILVGGQAFRQGGAEFMDSYPMVTHISSLDELENWIRKGGTAR